MNNDKLFKYSKLFKLLELDQEYVIKRGLNPIIEPGDNGDFEIKINVEKLNFNIEEEEMEEEKQKIKIYDLTVKPIISNDDSFNEAPNEYLPKIPFSMLLIARPGSGKTNTVIRLLGWYNGYFDKIFIISPTVNIDSSWVSAFEEGILDKDKFEFQTFYDEDTFNKILKKIKKKNNSTKEMSKKYKTLFIFDDIVGDMSRKQKTVINNFARNHRHYGISHITLSQEWTAVPPVMRKNTYNILLWDSDNQLERERIIEHLSGKIGKYRFARMWQDCVKQRFQFLMVRQFESNINKKYTKNFGELINPFLYSNNKFDMIDELKSENKIEEPEKEEPEKEEIEESEEPEIELTITEDDIKDTLLLEEIEKLKNKEKILLLQKNKEEEEEIIKYYGNDDLICNICNLKFSSVKRKRNHDKSKRHMKKQQIVFKNVI